MSAHTTSQASRRDAVDELLIRLERLQASAVTLRRTAADVHADKHCDALVAVLDAIDRDLVLAAREAARARREYAP
jgi:hypothetical protein